jgi:hypothetical protein
MNVRGKLLQFHAGNVYEFVLAIRAGGERMQPGLCATSADLPQFVSLRIPMSLPLTYKGLSCSSGGDPCRDGNFSREP